MLSHEDMEKLRAAAEGRGEGDRQLFEDIIKNCKEDLIAWYPLDGISWKVLYVMAAEIRCMHADMLAANNFRATLEERCKAIAVLAKSLEPSTGPAEWF